MEGGKNDVDGLQSPASLASAKTPLLQPYSIGVVLFILHPRHRKGSRSCLRRAKGTLVGRLH